MKAERFCAFLAVVLLAGFASYPIAASAQEKKKGKGIRVILIPQEDLPVNPPQGTTPPTSPPQTMPGTQLPPSSGTASTTPPSGSGTQSPPPPDRGPSGLAASVLREKIGSQVFQEYLGRLQSPGVCGRGGPCAHTWFDQAALGPTPGTATSPGRDTVTTPSGTSNFFRGNFNPPTEVDARGTENKYGGIPGGGVVLEGVASGLGSIEEIGYDRKFNAFVLDGRAVYFIKIPRKSLAELCRALAVKSEVGVSLGGQWLVYGAVGKTSDIAFDLTLVDRFLGDIVFARDDWTRGYRIARGYSPRQHEGTIGNMAIFFKFNGYRFQVQGREVVPVGGNLDVTLVPLSNQQAPDGNLLPDYDAIRSGRLNPQYEANARHVAENTLYYLREQLVYRAYAYGEIAAFLRWLKAEGANLRDLAASIE